MQLVISPKNLSLYEEGVKLSSALNAQLSFHTNPSHKGKEFSTSFRGEAVTPSPLNPSPLKFLFTSKC